ncbi:dna mismatch endonuclease vsr [Lucifera butyrica]|uniref:Very short patch repair endonuclease n=1 Tax=Lucifera butyrica TaxID=1351585 RepID=A0A498R2K2_9FIRM|nr:dna mismatch endonuclease vsr [Lucifera butyrica]
MPDRFTREERSRIMSRVKGKNTGPEIKIRSTLHSLGFRFRLNRKDLPGKPDIVLPKYKAVIFVHGCFWHGHSCKRGHRPQTNEEFWNKKIDGNIKRDQVNMNNLEKLGWRVLVIWQCEIKQMDALIVRIKEFLNSEDVKGH